MLRIAICDDDAETVGYHMGEVRRIMRQMGINADIRKCYTGDELLMEMEESGMFHIVLLDIEMQRMNGIETARRVRRLDPYAVLIFISAYDQYCKAAISVQPYAFLDKPAPSAALEKTLKEVCHRQLEEREAFDYHKNKVYYNVDLRDIYYFRSDLRKVYIIGKKEIQWFYGKLDEVEQILSRKKRLFIRIHKSLLVNWHYISCYRYEKIILQNGEELEISKSHRSLARRYYMDIIDEDE